MHGRNGRINRSSPVGTHPQAVVGDARLQRQAGIKLQVLMRTKAKAARPAVQQYRLDDATMSLVPTALGWNHRQHSLRAWAVRAVGARL